jgi:hypothetical protein
LVCVSRSSAGHQTQSTCCITSLAASPSASFLAIQEVRSRLVRSCWCGLPSSGNFGGRHVLLVVDRRPRPVSETPCRVGQPHRGEPSDAAESRQRPVVRIVPWLRSAEGSRSAGWKSDGRGAVALPNRCRKQAIMPSRQIRRLPRIRFGATGCFVINVLISPIPAFL